MNEITVFTATYNRKDLLLRLYQSLLGQTDKNFKWLIIDDASKDGTDAQVLDWINEKKIKIQYVYEEVNGGLQRAINHAYQITENGYILKVDSDDYLLPNAIEFFRNKIENIIDEKCLGIGAVYLKPDSTMLCMDNIKPKDNVAIQFHQRSRYGYGMDCIEIYNVNIRKNYPIPIWPTEKNGPERVAFSNMDVGGYYMQWYAFPVAVVNYQESGLTEYERVNWHKDPMSKAIANNYYQTYKFYDLKTRLFYCSEFVFWTLLGKNINYLFRSKKKILLIYGIPFGICKFIKRCKKLFK